jgi:hypothetical protein
METCGLELVGHLGPVLPCVLSFLYTYNIRIDSLPVKKVPEILASRDIA